MVGHFHDDFQTYRLTRFEVFKATYFKAARCDWWEAARYHRAPLNAGNRCPEGHDDLLTQKPREISCPLRSA